MGVVVLWRVETVWLLEGYLSRERIRGDTIPIALDQALPAAFGG